MVKDLPLAVIVDIDGTLAKMNGRSPYDWKRVGEDAVNNHVKNMVKLLSKTMQIIVFSGRDEICYVETFNWLERNEIPFDFLGMRPRGNFEKDAVIKKRLYESHVKGKYEVFAVIDDRLSVCKLWYELGLPLYRVGDPESNF